MDESASSYQSPAKCQFCQESEEIKWICFSCNLKLCGICNRKLHSLVQANQNHKVIALKDINWHEASDTRRRVNLESLTCEVHEGQKCVSYCSDCHVTLCLTCYDMHKDHHKNELLKLYQEKVTEIQKVKQSFSDSLSLVDNEERNLIKMNDNKSREYKKVKDDIVKREAAIIAEVKKFSQKLQDEVDHVNQPIMTEIQNNHSETMQTKVQLKEKKDIVDNILHSHQARDVIDPSKTIGNIPVPQQARDIPNTKCLFTPGDSLDSKVTQIFGDVNKIPELKLVNTFQTELNTVGNIINYNKNEKVISSYGSGKLQRVRFDNDSVTVIKEEDIRVWDMALMDNGDVVISSDRELKIYTEGGTVKPYKSFHPLYTSGVHVNKYNEVLVGLTESLSLITPDNIRKVVVLNQSGDIQHTYQYTRDKRRLFTWQYRILTCQDTICVVDLLDSSYEGRVEALDYGGQVQWVYNGEGNKSHNKFYPCGMAVTPTDLVLVADYINHVIHVLNPRGQVVVCHQVKDLGVDGPFSLCMDSEGLLWVGCKGSKDNKAKILYMTIM